MELAPNANQLDTVQESARAVDPVALRGVTSYNLNIQPAEVNRLKAAGFEVEYDEEDWSATLHKNGVTVELTGDYKHMWATWSAGAKSVTVMWSIKNSEIYIPDEQRWPDAVGVLGRTLTQRWVSR